MEVDRAERRSRGGVEEHDLSAIQGDVERAPIGGEGHRGDPTAGVEQIPGARVQVDRLDLVRISLVGASRDRHEHDRARRRRRDQRPDPQGIGRREGEDDDRDDTQGDERPAHCRVSMESALWTNV